MFRVQKWDAKAERWRDAAPPLYTKRDARDYARDLLAEVEPGASVRVTDWNGAIAQWRGVDLVWTQGGAA